MSRTTDAHESLLDRIDDLLVLSYLYESERACNPDLGHLQDLAREVGLKALVAGNKALFPGDRNVAFAVTMVINGLQDACRVNAPPRPAAVDVEWDGLPAVLSGCAMRHLHVEGKEKLAGLVTDLVARIYAGFPYEVKPYVTREQVAATLRALRRQRPDDFTGPIQVEILSSLAHQEFLAALDRNEAPLAAPGSAQAVAREYVLQAERSFVNMVVSSFVANTVAEYYPRAQQLQLDIDRVYPWGALWRWPTPAGDCLDLYARLNMSGAIQDGKFPASLRCGEGMSGEEFIRWAINGVPPRGEPGREGRERVFFNSDDANLQIDGKLVQKRAMMAVRYDKPLQDVERDVRHFRTYLLNQRKRYCANARESLSAEEVALGERLAAEMLGQVRPGRALLHDKSSVLGHLCALRDLEMERDPKHSVMSKKARVREIEQWVKKAGFTYGGESIRKACARSAAEIEALRARFVGA